MHTLKSLASDNLIFKRKNLFNILSFVLQNKIYSYTPYCHKHFARVSGSTISNIFFSNGMNPNFIDYFNYSIYTNELMIVY